LTDVYLGRFCGNKSYKAIPSLAKVQPSVHADVSNCTEDRTHGNGHDRVQITCHSFVAPDQRFNMGTSLTFAEMHNTLQDALDDVSLNRIMFDPSHRRKHTAALIALVDGFEK